MIAGGEILMLAHRGEEMRLVVGRHAFTLAVEDVSGVVNLPVPVRRNAARCDVDMQLRGQRAEGHFYKLAVGIGQLRKIFPWEEADVPRLGQHHDVSALFRRAPDKGDGAGEVVRRVTQAHIHLTAGDPHGR